jgi:hypothetical protein
MNQNDHASILKDEYISLQQSLEVADKKCLDIKGWNITLAAVLITAGFTEFKFSDILFIVGALASLVFWYMEAFYRGLTHFTSHRIKRIEEVFQNGDYNSEPPLQLYSSWEKLFKEQGPQTKKYFRKDHVYLPHLFISIICLILFVVKLVL